MLPVISVIIPVYKVEPYLRKCLDSVCNQTYTNLEIILVDDGSPDNCGRICDEYAEKDCRIRVIHQKNSGPSSARNAALNIAEGELIGFVDSDDWIEPDMFQFLYNNLIREDADISVCGLYEHRDGNMLPMVDPTLRAVGSHRDAVKVFLPLDIAGNSLWNKLYRKELLSDIRLPENRIWEDSFVMVQLIDNAKKVVFDMQPKYHYLRRPGSLTRSSYRPDLLDSLDSQLYIYNYTRQKYPELTVDAIYTSVIAHLFLLNLMLVTTRPVEKAHKQKVIRFFRENWKVIAKSPLIVRNQKLMIFLLCIHEALYKFLFNILARDIYEAVDQRPDYE